MIMKKNGKICFNEDGHKYYNIDDPEIKYVSVTELIGKFEPKFDSEFWSSYKALERYLDAEKWKAVRSKLLDSKKITDSFWSENEINEEEFKKVHEKILDEWKYENDVSKERGTEIHAGLERSFYEKGSDIELRKYSIEGKYNARETEDYNGELDGEGSFVYPEYLIHYDSPDGKVHIAGQIDLLVKTGNKFSIVDWKGLPLDTKLPTPSGWTTMGEVKEGDELFDKDGNVCMVTGKSKVHHNPCYRITFDTGESIVADADHRWLTHKGVVRTKNLIGAKIRDPQPLTPHKTGYNVSGIAGELNEALSNNAEGAIENLILFIKKQLRASPEDRSDALILGCQYLADPIDGNNLKFKCRRIPEFEELLRTFGVKVIVTEDGFMFNMQLDDDHRTVTAVDSIPTVPTQCIEVNSLSKTYLCGEMMMVTHNTNKKIVRSSYYDKRSGRSEKLLYPLNMLDNCNYNVYKMQLNTYAWMIKKRFPELECEKLVLVHFGHDKKMSVYPMDQIPMEVERMVSFWKKELATERHKAKNNVFDVIFNE